MTVMNLHQFTQKMSKIYGFSGGSQLYRSLAGQWFKCGEQICHAAAAVLIIFAFRASRLCWDASLLNQLPLCLVQADHWAQRVIRPLIYVQNILHPRCKPGSWLWNTPFCLYHPSQTVLLSGKVCEGWHDTLPSFCRMSTPGSPIFHPIKQYLRVFDPISLGLPFFHQRTQCLPSHCG